MDLIKYALLILGLLFIVGCKTNTEEDINNNNAIIIDNMIEEKKEKSNIEYEIKEKDNYVEMEKSDNYIHQEIEHLFTELLLQINK